MRLKKISLNLLLTLAAIGSIESWAKPLAAVSKVGENELVTVLANDKLLGPLVLGVALNIILTLVKMIWSKERKDLEEIKAAVRHIPGLIDKVNLMDEHLKKNVPSHDAVELRIFRALKDHKP